MASGKLYEMGPLVYGSRLNTRLTQGAYTELIYRKGASVLRMLHFLLTDPETGDGTQFFNLMKEFTSKYKGKLANTKDFQQLANMYFANSPIGKKYGLKDLDWFMRQWVYGTELPTYRLQYKVESRPEGGNLVTGMLLQEGVDSNWFMPLPLIIYFENGNHVSGVIHAMGPSTPVKVAVSNQIKRVELDPEFWILSAQTALEKK